MTPTFNSDTFNADEQVKLILQGADQDAINYYRAIMKAYPTAVMTPLPESNNVMFAIDFEQANRKVSVKFFVRFVTDKNNDPWASKSATNLKSINMAIVEMMIDRRLQNTSLFRKFEVIDPIANQEYLNGGKVEPPGFMYNLRMSVAQKISELIIIERERREVTEIADEFFPNRQAGREVYQLIKSHDDVIHEQAVITMKEIGKSLKKYFK